MCTFLRFNTNAPARAAQPAEMCTTVPPAKSRTPQPNRNPSGCQLQCANGAYTSKENNTVNRMYEVKRIRSATAPTTRPGVMIANIIWNKANNESGMLGAKLHGAPDTTSLKKRKVVGSPIKPI